jgi:hypothetical protein
MFLDVHHLFISRILATNYVECHPYFWVKNLQKATSFFEKGIFCHNFFFLKTIRKINNNFFKKKKEYNHSNNSTNYNFEDTSKMCP